MTFSEKCRYIQNMTLFRQYLGGLADVDLEYTLSRHYWGLENNHLDGQLRFCLLRMRTQLKKCGATFLSFDIRHSNQIFVECRLPSIDPCPPDARR